MTEDFSTLLDNTILQRAEPCTMAMLENLVHMPSAVHWSRLGRPLDGRTAVIVGAGPSLDRNVEVLRERQDSVCVFAVNTSAGALVHAGVAIDVLVSIESVPLIPHIAEAVQRRWVRTVALDLAAAPAMWRYTLDYGTPIWFSSRSPEALEVTEAVGVPALSHGNAGVTAAAALAHEWGASRIVLVGHDLSFGAGPAYADGAGWSGLKVVRDLDGLHFSGRADRELAHDAGGIPRLPRDRSAIMVPGYYTEQVATTGDYLWQLRWFERVARVWDTDLINSTEGGARITGWDQLHLVDALTDEGGPLSVWGSAVLGDVDRAPVEALRENAMQSVEVAERMLRGEDVTRCAGWLRPSDVVMSLCAPDMIRMERAGMSPVERAHGLYLSMLRNGRRVLEVLGGGDE